MDMRIIDSGSFTLARMAGHLDVNAARKLVQAVKDYVRGSGTALAIDLSDVDLIDSSGLSALVGLVTRARLAQGRVLLVAPSPFVSNVFRITNLDRWFEICGSLDEAQQRLTSVDTD